MTAGGFGPRNLPDGVTDEAHPVVAWGDEVVVTLEGCCSDRSGEDWISLGELTAEVRP